MAEDAGGFADGVAHGTHAVPHVGRMMPMWMAMLGMAMLMPSMSMSFFFLLFFMFS